MRPDIAVKAVYAMLLLTALAQPWLGTAESGARCCVGYRSDRNPSVCRGSPLA
jgi:hypothetical protein